MSPPLKSIRELVRRATPRSVRNWLRQPRRTIRYLVDRAKYAQQGASEIQLRSDWQLRCHPASRDHFRVFVTDPAQAAELDTFIEYCRPGMQFLDVGAHYGLFSLAAIHFGGPAVNVVAVEASANASKILRENVAANGATDRVQVVNAAMGGSDGVLEMLSTGPAGSDYFVSAPAGRADTTRVRQLSMPTILKETRLAPTHVKIDIEGFEDEAISGALDYLRHHQPILFLELHVRFLRLRGRDPAGVVQHLSDCGYVRFEENGTAISKDDLSARDADCRVICLRKDHERTH